MNIAVLIPSLDPDDALVTLVGQLQQAGVEQIVVIDDGSTEQAPFDRCAAMGCVVVHHAVNRGKGEALRTGLRAAQAAFPGLSGVVTADGDGQHAVRDILRVMQEVTRHSDCIVLGTRDFSTGNVPARSRFGNWFSSLFFRLSAGISCPDTQTGLRGIPASLFEFALSVPGSRYEYEMNVLFTAAREGIPLHDIPIAAIYEKDNRSSHFRPIADSARIYAMPLRFAAASAGRVVVDIVLFALFSHLFRARTARAILLATIGARVCSGVLNFTLNRNWSFSSTQDAWWAQGLRYLALFLCQMLASGGLVWLLSFLPLPLTLIKILVDTALFFASYFIQHNWVFHKS